MRLRYRTTGPNAVWYDSAKLELPRDVNQARTVLIERCHEYFGSQFSRYDTVVVSLLLQGDSLVDIAVDPLIWLAGQQLAADSLEPERNAA